MAEYSFVNSTLLTWLLVQTLIQNVFFGRVPRSYILTSFDAQLQVPVPSPDRRAHGGEWPVDEQGSPTGLLRSAHRVSDLMIDVFDHGTHLRHTVPPLAQAFSLPFGVVGWERERERERREGETEREKEREREREGERESARERDFIGNNVHAKAQAQMPNPQQRQSQNAGASSGSQPSRSSASITSTAHSSQKGDGKGKKWGGGGFGFRN